MAQRPVFIANPEGELLVRTENVTFDWFPGLSVSRKQLSIASLHQAARQRLGVDNILEVSGKSTEKLGTQLSAFNLMLKTQDYPHGISVECAFQGSKVFENGGPYRDLYAGTSSEAKRDVRLRNSGRLIKFHFEDQDWPPVPRTAFYDWLYITALMQNPSLVDSLAGYGAFTDIEFNPVKSINCQAYAIALYAALAQRGELNQVQGGQGAFLKLVGNRPGGGNGPDSPSQASLF
ncbi:DUF6977 family protein [Sodalis sp. RH21]|uniref:DarT1-associated NADAR antitoxin family protein n=1 Tax=unclassified Sodalis (in: enterobacteria) TaxID=2636512 RepID=UPI0039B6240A